MTSTQSAFKKVDWRGVIWFIGIAYGLIWLLSLPLWVVEKGLKSSWASLILIMSFTPAMAAFIVLRWISPSQHNSQAARLQFRLRRWRYLIIGWLGMLAFAVATPFVAAALGFYELDLVRFSGYQVLMGHSEVGNEQLLWRVLGFALLTSLTKIPFTFGEEYGWRGYLLPELLPLGQWPALIVSGAVWGLWHTPVILLGFGYPEHPVLGVVFMTFSAIILGILLGWLRLASGSIWPGVLGHAGINISAWAVLAFGKGGAQFDTTVVGITGWTGWILPILFIILLVVSKQLPVQHLPGSTLRSNQPPADPSYASLRKKHI